MNDMKGKTEMMLEALLAQSKNNLQHVITDNVGSTSGFTLMTNPMYGLLSDYPPSQMDVPTQSQSVHIPLSNEVPIMPENPNIHIDEEGPQFTRSMPKFQNAHLLTKQEHPRIFEAAEIFCDLQKQVRVVKSFSALRLHDICLVSGLVIPPKFKAPDFENYKGGRCTRHYLVMFYRKMASYTHEDKLMIHYSQDSLS